MSNYIYRAWVLTDGMKQSTKALPIYSRVVSLTESDSDDKSDTSALSEARSYRGFALLFSGKKDEALAWADKLKNDYRDTDGYLSYVVACLYAQAGESDKAFSSLERALQLGYGNRYEITEATAGRVTLAPIRKDSRFNALLARYSHLFE
jgi:tetratricopeptide (TPR) repeat protein